MQLTNIAGMHPWMAGRRVRPSINKIRTIFCPSTVIGQLAGKFWYPGGGDADLPAQPAPSGMLASRERKQQVGRRFHRTDRSQARGAF